MRHYVEKKKNGDGWSFSCCCCNFHAELESITAEPVVTGNGDVFAYDMHISQMNKLIQLMEKELHGRQTGS